MASFVNFISIQFHYCKSLHSSYFLSKLINTKSMNLVIIPEISGGNKTEDAKKGIAVEYS